eukprot:scaffold4924_cov84-Skeletonema_dohrnii-CCMP3373.AAC.3
MPTVSYRAYGTSLRYVRSSLSEMKQARIKSLARILLQSGNNNMANEVEEAGGIGVSAASGKGKAGSIDIDIDISSCCASCGIAEVDDIKLTTCDANCKLVRYCSVACQRDHRPSHEALCKKRVAALRDEHLFAQPGSTHLGDCPICFLPLAIDRSKRSMMSCCSKLICEGCCYTIKFREQNPSMKRTCPFCRCPLPGTDAEIDANIMKRVKANDPVPTRFVGIRRHDEGDYGSAFDYLSKAAGLGDIEALYRLSAMYLEGEGVEKDRKKAVYYMEEAAIAGHPEARYNLGVIEWNNGRKERAVKHWIIAANQGHDKSVEVEILKRGYTEGLVSKGDFAAALRAHQAAVDAMKSPQREAAEKAEGENIKQM